jgi:hypothetical protein
MFLRTTVTYWKSSVGHNMIRGSIEHFLNTNMMSDITEVSATKSRIWFVDSVKDNRVENSQLECLSTVAAIKEAADATLDSKLLTLSIFPKNNVNRTPVEVNIQASDIVYTKSFGDYLWVYHHNKLGGMTLSLADITMDEFGELIDSWNALYNILKSGDIWYKRETNTDGGYFKLWYSDDAGVTWEDLMTIDITEDSVLIDLDHECVHEIVGTSYHVSTEGGELLYNT